ncbi:MAG: hypothetical protein HUU35_13740 [Armatimonadetes bacterium]|nr:hypothetical protein [Armatimonadota bacterium]
MMHHVPSLEGDRFEAVAVPLVLALGGGAVAAVVDAYLPLLELKPVVAGAACIGIGMVARRWSLGYLMGLVFSLSWALTLVTSEQGAGWPATLLVALVCGLTVLGPVAALGALLCEAHCPDRRWRMV